MTGCETETMVKELAARVREQVTQLRELEAVLRAQQAALAGRDVEAILATLTEQSARLNALREAEAERTRVLARLAAALGIPAGAVTLRQLAGEMSGPLRDELESLSNDGREVLAIVGRVNADNRRLIQDSLDFVESMLAALAGRAPAKPTYLESGAILRSQIDTLVDHSA